MEKTFILEDVYQKYSRRKFYSNPFVKDEENDNYFRRFYLSLGAYCHSSLLSCLRDESYLSAGI